MKKDSGPLHDVARQLDVFDIADEEPLPETDDSQEAAALYTEAEAPRIIAQLYSEDLDEFERATEALTSIAVTQPDLLSPHVASLIPSALAHIPRQNDESRRSALIDLLSQLDGASDDASEILRDRNSLECIVRMLRCSETMDKYSLVNFLEELLERAEELDDGQTYVELEEILIDVLQHHLYELEPEPSVETSSEKGAAGRLDIADTLIKAVANAIEVFELTLVLMKTHLRSASLKAGALEFLILTSINPTPSLANTTHASNNAATNARIAAITCLEEVYSRIVEDEVTASDIPTLDLDPDDKLKLRSLIIVPLLNLIGDEDDVVSDKAVEVLYGRINDEDRSVEQFFWAHEGSVERLVRKLVLHCRGKGSEDKEEPASAKEHSLPEWLLSVLIQRERACVVDAFSSLYSDENVDHSVKKDLVSILPDTLSNIQEVAKCAGVGLEMDGHLG